MCLAQGPQRSGDREAGTRGPSVSSQALYHWATALHGVDVKTVWANDAFFDTTGKQLWHMYPKRLPITIKVLIKGHL